jgi:hypothetical protein
LSIQSKCRDYHKGWGMTTHASGQINRKNSLKEIIRKNPRSTSTIKSELFIKTSSQLSLVNEANELKRCQESAIRTPHVRALDLVAYSEHDNRLTTRFVPDGLSLYNVLWNGTGLFGFLKRLRWDVPLILTRMEEIGCWLRLYHGSTEAEGRGAEALENLQDLYLSKIESAKRLGILRETFLAGVVNRFVEEIKNAADPAYHEKRLVRFCRIQGDFAVGNMLVDPDWQIYILDFADSRIGVTLEDVARFYEQVWAISQTSRRRAGFCSQILDAFLRGYGAPLGIERTAFFKALVGYNGLISCITEFTTAPYIRSQILTRIELKRLKNATLRWMSREIGCGS